MKRDDAIAYCGTMRSRHHEAELEQLGVRHLYLFGSTARGKASAESDVDLFFDYEKTKLGLFELMDVRDYAASILGCNADVRTCEVLAPKRRGGGRP